MYSTFKQRPIGPPLAGIVAVVALLLLWPTPPAAQESTPTLDGLTLSDGAILDPTFVSTTYEYEVEVPYAVEILTVNVSASSGVTASYISTDVSNVAGLQVNLRVGETTIRVRATDDTDGNTQDYTITVTRAAPSKEATLTDLTLSPGTLTPTFDEDEAVYTASVPRNTVIVKVTPTLPDGATVSYNKVDSAPITKRVLDVSLEDGANRIIATVTAEDGRTTKTYTITVTRPGSDFDDATLRALRISPGTLSPTFDPEVLAYTASVANGVRNLTVYATPTASGATARIGTDEIPRGGLLTVLKIGPNTITVQVTPEDGDPQGYIITVNRADVSNKDNSLGSLSLSPGTLSPAFDPAKISYTAFVPHATAIITVLATPTAEGATVAYMLDESASSDSEPTRSGHQVGLGVGPNTITVQVTSQDGMESTTTYTITVTRGAAPAMDTTLRSLRVSPGTLSPAFNPAQSSYEVKVYYEVEVITVAAVKNASTANVTITPVDSDQSTNGHQVGIAVGTGDPITVQVTANDGTDEDYTITVTRLAAESLEAKLTDLTLTPSNDSRLSPGFNEDRFEYAFSVGHTVGFITVVATAAAGATIAYDPPVDAIRGSSGHQVELRDGQTRTITVTVTSPDGRKQQRYIIRATRAAAPSTDATLIQLVPVDVDVGEEGSLNQTFDPYKGDYTAFVEHGVALFTVNPLANAAAEGATIAYSALDSQPAAENGH